MYLYYAVNSEENTIDLHLSKSRNHKARVITVDKHPAYPIAIEKLKKEKAMPASIQTRRLKYNKKTKTSYTMITTVKKEKCT
ncbi:hypothetical protein AT270_29940 [Bacillus cereus]|nr:hypothetical protein AT270_29940 [Bacillus cereus]